MNQTMYMDFGALGEHTVDIEYDFMRGYAGTYYEPPEPDGVEIISVMWGDKDVLPLLSSERIEQIEIECLECAREAICGCY